MTMMAMVDPQQSHDATKLGHPRIFVKQLTGLSKLSDYRRHVASAPSPSGKTNVSATITHAAGRAKLTV